jgi:serine/threonine-protein kinase
MPDPSQPTITNFGGDAGAPGSSFPSIEEGRFLAGTTLAGRFRILGLLGKGGMGEVYRALDLTLNQPVALKFIAPGAHRDEAALARFRNEVRIARQVSHPNVCRVYDIGVIEGQHFLSMEYVDGEDLASLLRRIGRLPADKALEFTRRICAGLAAAHERGVLHRDLKPANIMIDARGQVRITDFGLAALAGGVYGGEIRSGTPAYMSPEQKAGKDVTTRSDLYALGIVLHEMFTGKRPGDSQATPTTLVKDLDPTIERVIQRCLEADPRNRPSSALNVAMALPGGDPIAAALAAGETPSPEMVAASGEKEGLRPRTAVACFLGVGLLLVALVLLSNKTTLVGRAPLPLPPDALAFKAREMLTGFGYTEEPVDSAYGMTNGNATAWYLRYLSAHDAGHRWERLASHRPALTHFWYRQHQGYLQPLSFLAAGAGAGMLGGLINSSDPPRTLPGMVGLILDAKGRLHRLDALPSPARSPTAAGPAQGGPIMDWNRLLAAADLDAAQLTPSPPEVFVPVYADSRKAWVGSYGEGRPDTIRVEAAALNGRPVFFEIRGPWWEAESADTPPGQRARIILFEILAVALLVAAMLVAWRNVRMGRGDRRGAWRVAAAMFAAGAVSWALVAAHVPTQWEMYLLLLGLSWAGFRAGFIGLLYLAIEPFVRRQWPDALISWMRMIGGRFRDPLAMSHVLVGLSAGVALPLVGAVMLWATNDLAAPSNVGLSGSRFLFGLLLGNLVGSAFGATGLTLVLVLLRSAVGRTWVADVLFVVLLTLPFLSPPALLPEALLGFAIFVWVIRRFGLLAIVVLQSTRGALENLPITAASWYAPLALTTPLLIAAVGAWSLYVILTSRPGAALSSGGNLHV